MNMYWYTAWACMLWQLYSMPTDMFPPGFCHSQAGWCRAGTFTGLKFNVCGKPRGCPPFFSLLRLFLLSFLLRSSHLYFFSLSLFMVFSLLPQLPQWFPFLPRDTCCPLTPYPFFFYLQVVWCVCFPSIFQRFYLTCTSIFNISKSWKNNSFTDRICWENVFFVCPLVWGLE